MKMKKLFVALATLVAGLSLAACSSGEKAQTPLEKIKEKRDLGSCDQSRLCSL